MRGAGKIYFKHQTCENNATVTIRGAISEFQGFMSEKPTQKYKQMHVELEIAASVTDFDKIMNIKNEMELLVEKYPMLKSIDLDMTQIINQEGESYFTRISTNF